ncbi:Uncharacterized protein GBIM_09056, partial [Gryllus bimaculatus]
DFDEVKQLEELKNSLVSRDGQLVARLQQRVDSTQEEAAATPATRVLTEVDIPERGVHKTLLQQPQQPQAQAPPQAQPQQPAAPQPGQEAALAQPQSPPPPPPPADITDNGERRAAPDTNSLAKYLPYSGVQYSPLDMAEYVFWTGDERGVTLAIEEFLQEGLMTREEAINFLQEIKYNLDFLQTHYAQQRLHKQEQIQAKERATLIQKALGLDKPRAEPKMSTEITHEGLFTKKSIPDIQATPKDITMMNNNRLQQQNLGLSDEDYEELLERLRVADFLYTEYSLEEVIYQLAKVMFAQSLNRGNADAQEALQKFTNFLESEAEQGHISRSLEKKVLDVLIASLADTLSEHPHLVNAAREGLGSSGGNKLLHQLLLLNPAAVVGEGAGAGGTGNNQDFTSGNDSHQSTLAKARQMVDANGGSTNKSNKAT